MFTVDRMVLPMIFCSLQIPLTAQATQIHVLKPNILQMKTETAQQRLCIRTQILVSLQHSAHFGAYILYQQQAFKRRH